MAEKMKIIFRLLLGFICYGLMYLYSFIPVLRGKADEVSTLYLHQWTMNCSDWLNKIK